MARESRPPSKAQPSKHSATATLTATKRTSGRKAAVPATDTSAAMNEPPAAQPDGHTPPNGEIHQQMIAEAAYYRALNRGFVGGDPNEDWFAAEREIVGGPRPGC